MRRLLTLRADRSEVGRLLRTLEAFGTENQIPSHPLEDMTLALDELVTNVMAHSGLPREEIEILVEIRISGDDLIGRIEEGGLPFDPTQANIDFEDQDIEKIEPGGAGIRIARELIDEMRYRRAGDRNVLTIRKRLT